MSPITIYTDGSALGNPGPGGYGAVLLSGHHRKELSQGFRLTTNNRMELMAVCVALETLKFEGSDVVIYSDSKYVVDAVSKGWVFGWVRKGFASGSRATPKQSRTTAATVWPWRRPTTRRTGSKTRATTPQSGKTGRATPFFRQKVHHNPSNYRTFFAFRVIIPIFTPLIA